MKNVDDLDGRELLARIESLAAENTRLKRLVADAYYEGFNDHENHEYWFKSKSRKALEGE